MIENLKRTVALAALITAMEVGAAQADEGWYGRVDAGYSVDGEIELDDTSFDLEDDWMADVGLGYGFANGFRGEAELAYRNNEVDGFDEDAQVWSLMINAFYDFNRGGGIEPYIGAGIGYGQLETFDEEESGMVWQGLVRRGLTWPGTVEKRGDPMRRRRLPHELWRQLRRLVRGCH